MSDAGLTPHDLWQLQQDVSYAVRRVKENGTRIDVIERRGAQRDEWEKNISEDVGGLKKTLDRLTWAIVMLALTVAASAIGLAIQLGAGH